VAAADRCLALAAGERVRDEALNLKACGLHYLDDSAGAITALEEAIEGAYSEALLANIGIVAAGLRPDVAARYLGKLMDEAPTTAMRVAAGQRAVDIWARTDTSAWQTSEGSLPDVIRDPLRALVTQDIELDDFRSFVALLATQDSDWLAEPDHLSPSPHGTTLEARFYAARARDLGDMLDVMAGALQGGDPPRWLLHERQSLRDTVVEIVVEHLDDPDSTLGPLALAMQEKGIVEGAYDRVLFAGTGLASIAYQLSSAQKELADRLVDTLHQVRGWWSALDEDQRDRLAPVVELATRRVALNRMDARDRDLGEAMTVFNRAVDIANATYRGSPAWLNVLPRVNAARAVAVAARTEMVPWLPMVEHDGARKDIELTVKAARELEGLCGQFL
jgi:hypothetical protein